MKKRLLILLLPLLLFAGLRWLLPVSAQSVANPTLTVGSTPIVQDVKPFGINIGAHNPFGSAQILKNVIVNPGFEAGEYGMLVIAAAGATSQTVQAHNWFNEFDQTAVITDGQPIGFWNGASYRSVYGVSKGRSGTVANFTHEPNLQTQTDQYQTFRLDSGGTIPVAGDVFVMQRMMTDTVQGCCGNANTVPDSSEIRPGSIGEQSLKMLPPDAVTRKWLSYSYYMDSYGRDGDISAGRLMQFDGDWRLTFWVKAERQNEPLDVSVRREGTTQPFFEETILLSQEWQLIERDFSVLKSADPIPATAAVIALTMNLENNAQAVWIDDISLARSNETNPTVFTDQYVNYLKELQPGILRDWGNNQLGSTLDNQLVPTFARKTTGWSPMRTTARTFHFSLGEFLALCLEVGAEPWYVVPPTFSLAEMENLAAYLAAPVSSGHEYALLRQAHGQENPWTDVFPTIHLEYGNEMWGSGYGGDPFWGATVRGGQRLGQIAHDHFAAFRNSAHFDAGQFNLIIGGQTRYVPQNVHIENNSTTHDSMALAPYFGALSTYETTADIYYPLFAEPLYQSTIGGERTVFSTTQLLEQHGTTPTIYEINFHTTSGDVPLDIRNDYVTGLGGGLALPLHMLTYLRDLGIRDQVGFTTLQYSFPVYGAGRSAEPEWYQREQFYDRLFERESADSRANTEFVRLWGMLRDLEATGRKRPSWLGMELVNPLIAGDMIAVQGENIPSITVPPINDLTVPIELPLVQGFAFKDGSDVSMLLFNLSLTETITVDLNLQAPAARSTVDMQILTGAFITEGNESAENVQITTVPLSIATTNTIALSPHSLAGFAYQASEIPTAIALQHNSLPDKSALVPLVLLAGLLCAVSVNAVVNSRRNRLQ